MAARKPIVRSGGRTRQLPAGDNLLGYARQYEQETEPSDARAVNDTWTNPATGRIYRWFIDGNGVGGWVAWGFRTAAAVPFLTNQNIEWTASSVGPILRADNGTRYRLVVNNSGVLGTVPA